MGISITGAKAMFVIEECDYVGKAKLLPTSGEKVVIISIRTNCERIQITKHSVL